MTHPAAKDPEPVPVRTDGPTPQSCLEQSWATEDAGDLAAAREAAIIGAELAEAAGDVDMFVALRVQQGRMAHGIFGFAGAVEVYAGTMPYLDKCRNKARVIDFLSSYAVCLANCGDVGTANAHLRRALALAESCDAETRMLIKMRSCEIQHTIGPSEQVIEDSEAALALFATLPICSKTDFRYAFARLLIARSWIRKIAGEAGAHLPPADQLRRIVELLDEADARATAQIPVMIGEIDLLRNFFERITGGDIRLIRSRVFERDWKSTVHSGDPVQRDMSAWAQYEAETGGDLELARFLLDQTRPDFHQDVLTVWERDWTTARAALHQAEGDLAAACATYREQIHLETQSRQRYFAILTEIGRQVAETEELKQRERRAMAKAARLAAANAALASEKDRLRQAALSDPLTGLGNRRFLEECLRDVSGGPHTVVMLDIDHFKTVNDRFSHQVGDAVLAALGRILLSCFRKEDLCVRFGGEEFLVLLKAEPNPRRLERLRQAVQDFDWAGVAPGLAVTTSIGAAAWTSDLTFAEALARADARLYEAKKRGRNRVVMDDGPVLMIA